MRNVEQNKQRKYLFSRFVLFAGPFRWRSLRPPSLLRFVRHPRHFYHHTLVVVEKTLIIGGQLLDCSLLRLQQLDGFEFRRQLGYLELAQFVPLNGWQRRRRYSGRCLKISWKNKKIVKSPNLPKSRYPSHSVVSAKYPLVRQFFGVVFGTEFLPAEADSLRP